MKIIDKTDGLRPYDGGLYAFVITYTTGKEQFATARTKSDFIKSLNKNKEVQEIKIDIL